jgi:hypothetical protein
MRHLYYSILVVALAVMAIAATRAIAGGPCGCHGAGSAAYTTQPSSQMAAGGSTNRQYSYQPRTVAQRPTTRTYSTARRFRSYSYVPGNAVGPFSGTPGNSYTGPFRGVRGASSKANFDYAPRGY